jgi:hypothetical protein
MNLPTRVKFRVFVYTTVKSVTSGHSEDQKLVSVQDHLPFGTGCFYRECVAEGQKQTGC